jgi:hypothetical protein
MKIFEETNTRLIIKHKPITSWMMGGLFFTVGIILFVHSICLEFATALLVCSRSSQNQVNCELIRRTSIGIETKVKLFDPQNAYVKIKTAKKGGKSYKTIIVTPHGEFSPLNNASHQQNSNFVAEVNNFITSGKNDLSVQQNQRDHITFLSFLSLAIILIGACSATEPKTNCSFYKSMGKVIIERRGLRGAETIEHPLEQILNIEIEEKRGRRGRMYRPVIVLINSQKIPITSEFTNQERYISEIVGRINLFLRFKKAFG